MPGEDSGDSDDEMSPVAPPVPTRPHGLRSPPKTPPAGAESPFPSHHWAAEDTAAAVAGPYIREPFNYRPDSTHSSREDPPEETVTASRPALLVAGRAFAASLVCQAYVFFFIRCPRRPQGTSASFDDLSTQMCEGTGCKIANCTSLGMS